MVLQFDSFRDFQIWCETKVGQTGFSPTEKVKDEPFYRVRFDESKRDQYRRIVRDHLYDPFTRYLRDDSFETVMEDLEDPDVLTAFLPSVLPMTQYRRLIRIPGIIVDHEIKIHDRTLTAENENRSTQKCKCGNFANPKYTAVVYCNACFAAKG